eukprot:TRINITY_DN1233_c0_g1_i7.p3 TRINITY_DN1233_c0_g1~~TRINITY_DN1233_c0_g1_i7.p3  ORF type:complete len:110 (+),score=10.80 TRINITY_DN1233_c0_g1_i7:95-424(+)
MQRFSAVELGAAIDEATWWPAGRTHPDVVEAARVWQSARTLQHRENDLRYVVVRQSDAVVRVVLEESQGEALRVPAGAQLWAACSMDVPGDKVTVSRPPPPPAAAAFFN